MFSRRSFLGAVAALTAGHSLRADKDTLPPVRQITAGPKLHWFGYYDKLEFDPTGRYVLGMEVDFEHRSPKADDLIRIGMIDLEDKDRWIDLGRSTAWCWQQGCMLQWIPGSRSEILWNDRESNRYVCRILDVKTKKERVLPHPIYALNPDGKTAISPDFRRLNDVRPGYGYVGITDPHADEMTPDKSGIWKIDLARGKQELLFSIADVARTGTQTDSMKDAKHWFNHLLFNTDGSRFVFLHRWRPRDVKQTFYTRMITASADGKDLHVVDPSGNTSHFIWRDAKHLLAWTRPAKMEAGFYLFEDNTDKVEQIGKGVMTVNGHCTYLPGNDWILNDTYPDGDRLQHPYLYHVATGKRVDLGHFLSPKEYNGEWRCDTHPRFSPDGTKVVIDSPHKGGRQLHLIDVNAIVKKT